MNAHLVIDARPAAQILILRKANVTTAVIGGYIRRKDERIECMTDKIYGIFEGAYSDWNCIGYFENEEEAYRYCAETESKYDRPYVMEIERINCEFSNETVFYEYHCSFKNNEINWIHLESCFLHPMPPKIRKNPLHGSVYLEFTIQKFDEELARKTAFDLYAKWKYERDL